MLAPRKVDRHRLRRIEPRGAQGGRQIPRPALGRERDHVVAGRPLRLLPDHSRDHGLRLEAAQLAGYPLNPDFNGEKQDGVGFYTFTQINGERMTAERAYLDPIRQRPNLTVITDKPVTRVLMEGKRAVGIAWKNGAEAGEIRGKEIILSAGSFVSPQLLMLSGIGNARELERYGIPVVADLPGVGENLQDHLDITLEYRTKTTAPYGISWRALPRNILHVLDWIFRRRGLFATTTAEAGGFVSTRPEVERPDIQLFFCAAVGNTQNAAGFTGHGFLVHATDLRPGSVGRLRLKSADPNEKPSILFNFFRDASTMDALREGVKIIRRIVAQPPFGKHMGHEADPGPDAAPPSERDRDRDRRRAPACAPVSPRSSTSSASSPARVRCARGSRPVASVGMSRST